MRSLVVLSVVVLNAASACGSHSSAGSTSTSAADAAKAYVAAGNQVCIRSDKRIYALGRLSRDPKGWEKTAAVARTAVQEMRRVTPPPSRSDAFKRMLKYASALTLAVQEVGIALKNHKIDTAVAAQFAAGQLQDKVHRSAQAAGLTFCQQALTNWPA